MPPVRICRKSEEINVITVCLSSRPREFHPQPLSEPYVKVSLHTALRIQIISFDVHRVHILLANDKTDWVLSELYRLTNNEQI